MNTFINPKDLGIKTRRSLLSTHNFIRGIRKVEKPPINSWQPIGIGKPLVVRLHTVHVGDFKNWLLNKKQAIIVTSLIKDDITYEVPPRGVHQIYNRIKDGQTLYPKASVEGTELIYYSSAFDKGKLKFEIEVKANKFDQDIVENISSTLTTAAGLPIFAPFAPFALVGSQLLKIGGDIIDKAIDKQPFLSYGFDIHENLGGLRNSQPGYLIGGNSDELHKLDGYEIVEDRYSNGNVYLAKNSKKYTGPIPYIIISVDGRSNQRYDNFKATIASASILKKFYSISGNTNLDNIQAMLNIYNDYSYINKIRSTQKSIEKTKDESKIQELNALLEAYKANIKNDDMQKLMGLVDKM